MKFKSLFISALCVCGLAMTSCDNQEDATYTPAEPLETPEVYMALQPAQAVEFNDVTLSLDVQMFRADATEAASYPVTVTGSNLAPFTAPATVDFAAESNQATFTITGDPAQLSMTEDYTLAVSVGDGTNAAYYAQTQEFVVSYVTWMPVVGPNGEQMAAYQDDFVWSLYAVNLGPYEVPLEENPGIPGLYRLVNPYGVETPWGNVGGCTASTTVKYIYLNAANPNKVFISNAKGQALEANGLPSFSYLGFQALTYGEMSVTGKYNVYLYQGKSDAEAASGTVGTLKNGVITFPTNSLYIQEAGDDNLYTANRNGGFMVVFPGASAPEPEPEPEPETGSWTSVGTAQFTDPWYYPLFQVPDPMTWEVAVEQNTEAPTQFRLVNPYSADVCPDGEAYDGDKYFVFDVAYPECVIIEPQYLGINDGANPMYFSNWAGAYVVIAGKGPEEIIGMGKNGTFYDEGAYTVSIAPGDALMMFDMSGDVYTPNVQLEGKIVMSGAGASAAAVAAGTRHDGFFRHAVKAHFLNSNISVQKSAIKL